MTVSILCGDCRDLLRSLPDESVHCVVTSPPYWGLRDYGTAKWEGGDPACDHLMAPNGVRDKGRDRAASGGMFHDSPIANQIRQQFGKECGKCGARRIDNQLGLEASLGEHVAGMVAVFREVRRVLRKDGTLWLNYGDSYAAQVNGRSAHDTKLKGNDDRTFRDKPFSTIGPVWRPGRRRVGYNEDEMGRRNRNGLAGFDAGYLKPKDLCGIPWRVAFALQEDGWWLRQDIIWSKPNPMPESVTDRCTKAHEYLFLLAKSERYYYDAEAIKEQAAYGFSPTPQMFNGVGTAASSPQRKIGAVQQGDGGSRNKRSVWEVTTQPFSEAHFATFPPALIEPCIKAGCPVGGTVLDPFGGAGTTGLVADRLQRNAILIELNPQYAEMAEHRLRSDAPLFVDIAPQRSGETPAESWAELWADP